MTAAKRALTVGVYPDRLSGYTVWGQPKSTLRSTDPTTIYLIVVENTADRGLCTAVGEFQKGQ
jgi:hypothetical protein